MNERIKELAKEAGLLAHNSENTPTKLDVFAQLVIRDCLKIVEHRTKGPYDIAMTQETRNAWNIWIEIKEHFGVKYFI